VSGYIDPDLFAKIQELWSLVYQKAKITNGSIYLSFVKGVLAEKKKTKVNWACYASQSQGMGGRGHKKLIIDNVKILKK
jgi:hypothetical protein